MEQVRCSNNFRLHTETSVMLDLQSVQTELISPMFSLCRGTNCRGQILSEEVACKRNVTVTWLKR